MSASWIDAVDHHLEVRRQPARGAFDVQRHLDARPRREVVGERAQRVQQPEIVQRGGTQQVAQVAHLVERAADQRSGLLPPVQLQLDLHRRQHLAGFVVQLTRDAPPLVLLHAQHQARQLLELRAPGRKPLPLAAEDEEQQAEADGEEEQDVGEDAVEHCRAEPAQQRVVEVVQPPEHEHHGQHRRRRAAGHARRGRARTRRPCRS